MGLSHRKKLRNKRRLLQFLLRKLQEGIKINIDLFKFMKDIQEGSDNSGPECRLISVIATVQKSNSSWKIEGKHVKNIFKKKLTNLKFPFYDRRGSPFEVYESKLTVLSTNETMNRGFTHRYQLYVIANLNIKDECAKKYVSEDLCKFRGVNASSGEKLFFQVDNG